MTFGGCECGLKFIRGEEQPSWSNWRFWKILVNRSTQESMPMTAMPEGKFVCIGGDGGELNSPSRRDRSEYPTSLFCRLFRPANLCRPSFDRLADVSFAALIGVCATAPQLYFTCSQPVEVGSGQMCHLIRRQPIRFRWQLFSATCFVRVIALQLATL